MTSSVSLSLGSLASISALRPTAAASEGTRAAPSSAAAEGSSNSAGAQVFFNPRIRFDSAANVIVAEFRDSASGEVQRTVPSERQLQAYVQARRDPAPESTAQDFRTANTTAATQGNTAAGAQSGLGRAETAATASGRTTASAGGSAAADAAAPAVSPTAASTGGTQGGTARSAAISASTRQFAALTV